MSTGMTDYTMSDYTPQKQPGLLVIIGGLVTTAIAMGLVMLVSSASDGEFNLMGFYLWFIIPVSAIAVGALAGSGYTIVSWMRGVRVVGWLLVIVVILLVCAYFASCYVEFAMLDPYYEDGSKPSFWEYFDLITRSYTFTDVGDSAADADQLGKLGYGLRALEIVGFSFGGLIPLLALLAKPYCKRCQAYMKSSPFGNIPTTAPFRKVKRKDIDGKVAYRAENQKAAEDARETLKFIEQCAQDEDPAALAAVAAPLRKNTQKKLAKVPQKYQLKLHHCPICYGGHLSVVLVDGRGNDTTRTDQPKIEMSGELIRKYVGGSAPIDAAPTAQTPQNNMYADQD